MDHLVSTLTSWIHQFGKNYAILMIGNSSSGKSTLSIRLSSMLGVKIVSSDLIRSSLSLTGDPTDQSVNQFAWEMVHRQIESTLSSEQRVIVDVTNALSSDRQAMVENLRVQTPIVLGVWLDTPLNECLRRNLERDWPRPEHAIRRMDRWLNAYETVVRKGQRFTSTPPSLSDGFTALWRVGLEDWK